MRWLLVALLAMPMPGRVVQSWIQAKGWPVQIPDTTTVFYVELWPSVSVPARVVRREPYPADTFIVFPFYSDTIYFALFSNDDLREAGTSWQERWAP